MEVLKRLEHDAPPVGFVRCLDRIDDLVGVCEGDVNHEDEEHEGLHIVDHEVEARDVELGDVEVFDLVEQDYKAQYDEVRVQTILQSP